MFVRNFKFLRNSDDLKFSDCFWTVQLFLLCFNSICWCKGCLFNLSMGLLSFEPDANLCYVRKFAASCFWRHWRCLCRIRKWWRWRKFDGHPENSETFFSRRRRRWRVVIRVVREGFLSISLSHVATLHFLLGVFPIFFSLSSGSVHSLFPVEHFSGCVFFPIISTFLCFI